MRTGLVDEIAARDRLPRPGLGGAHEVEPGLVHQALRPERQPREHPARRGHPARDAPPRAARRHAEGGAARWRAGPSFLSSTASRWRAEEILGAFLEAFPGRVSLACSFQKEESVLLDMLFAIDPKARVFALDTHVLFPETYAVWREVEQRYGTKVEIYEGPTLARQAESTARRSGSASPTSAARSARSSRSAARSAGSTRGSPACAATSRRPARTRPKVGWDEDHELWKANPLADWDDQRCWDYIRERDLPVQRAARPRLRLDRLHALHQAGRRPRGPLGRRSTRPSAGCHSRSARTTASGRVDDQQRSHRAAMATRRAASSSG